MIDNSLYDLAYDEMVIRINNGYDFYHALNEVSDEYDISDNDYDLLLEDAYQYFEYFHTGLHVND